MSEPILSSLVHPNSTLVEFYSLGKYRIEIVIYEPQRAKATMTMILEEARGKWYKLLDEGFEEKT